MSRTTFLSLAVIAPALLFMSTAPNVQAFGFLNGDMEAVSGAPLVPDEWDLRSAVSSTDVSGTGDTYSLEMDSTGKGGTFGRAIPKSAGGYVAVPLADNTEYTFSFEHKGDVLVGNVIPVGMDWSTTDQSATWDSFSYTWTTGVGETVFPFFYDWHDGGTLDIGKAWIDNVSLVATIPEPLSFALFGMGGLLVLVRRRR